MTDIEPGWYRDPADPTTQRYWDGEGWIGDPIPADATPPAGRPPEAAPSDFSQPSGSTRTRDGVSPATTPGETIGPGSVPPGTEGYGTGLAGPSRPSGTPGPGPSAGDDAPATGMPPVDVPTGVPLPYVMLRRLVPDPRPHGLTLAPLSARFVARLIDIIAVFGLNVVVNGWFVWRYVSQLWPYVVEFERRLLANESTADLSTPPQAAWLQIVILFLAAALWFAYEVPAIANTGQTLGKRLMRIKVVRVESEEPLGFGRAWRRWNPLGMPTLLWSCCGIGFLLQAGDLLMGVLDRPMHQALHDKSAATVVVNVPRSPEARDPEAQDPEARDPEARDPKNGRTGQP